MRVAKIFIKVRLSIDYDNEVAMLLFIGLLVWYCHNMFVVQLYLQICWTFYSANFSNSLLC